MPTKDRLHEINSDLSNGQVYNETVIKCDRNDVPNEIKEIFSEVEKIRGWINIIDDNTRMAKKLFCDSTFHASKSLQEQVNSLVITSNATGLKACGALRQFETRLPQLGGDACGRIARLQYATTHQLYCSALAAHDAFLQSYRDTQLTLLQEQIKITNCNVTDEECKSLLESNNFALFVDNLDVDTKNTHLALRDVEARHNEIMKIETSIQEVRNMFVQMALLVSQQQDQIDTVEYYATQASDHIVLGGKQLEQGKVNKRKARKKKISLIMCLVIGFLVILLVLVLT